MLPALPACVSGLYELLKMPLLKPAFCPDTDNTSDTLTRIEPLSPEPAVVLPI